MLFICSDLYHFTIAKEILKNQTQFKTLVYNRLLSVLFYFVELGNLTTKDLAKTMFSIFIQPS